MIDLSSPVQVTLQDAGYETWPLSLDVKSQDVIPG